MAANVALMTALITAGSARIHSGITHNVNSNRTGSKLNLSDLIKCRTEPMWVLGRVPFPGCWWTHEDPPRVNEGRFPKMFLGVQLSPDLAWKVNHNSIKHLDVATQITQLFANTFSFTLTHLNLHLICVCSCLKEGKLTCIAQLNSNAIKRTLHKT